MPIARPVVRVHLAQQDRHRIRVFIRHGQIDIRIVRRVERAGGDPDRILVGGGRKIVGDLVFESPVAVFRSRMEMVLSAGVADDQVLKRAVAAQHIRGDKRGRIPRRVVRQWIVDRTGGGAGG